MYLSVGSSKNIRIKNILGVFDLESTTVSPITRRYLSSAEKNDGVTYTNGFELPKSFVVYRVNKRNKNKGDRRGTSHPRVHFAAVAVGACQTYRGQGGRYPRDGRGISDISASCGFE